MKIIKITRDKQDINQTVGTCVIYDECDMPIFSALSLERGWRENKKSVSCVPLGSYDVVLEYSPRFDMHLWELKDVENRSECKFHSANYWYQLNGCIALGNRLADINNDGYNDVLSSKLTMRAFHKTLNGDTKALLIIK